jgi:hypothetical protein
LPSEGNGIATALKNADKIDISCSVPASGVSPSPPVATAAGVSISGGALKLLRVALYVDGFNLYHALEKLNQPHLKWLNLWALGERLLTRGQHRLVRVFYASAKKDDNPEKSERHQEYINALKSVNVEVCLGHFLAEAVIECRKCGHHWNDNREKETDINLALAIIDDAYQDVFDVAFLVTADSDQAATARVLTERFPEKRLVSIVPPNMAASKAIKTYAPLTVHLREFMIAECLFPQSATQVVGGKEITTYRRPSDYDPPPNWTPAMHKNALRKGRY